MKVLSVNVGKPKTVTLPGKTFQTGIYKSKVSDEVQVNKLNLFGDEQVDKRVHGGLWKAVYVYPFEHYSLWRKKFPNLKLEYGAFGENITAEGLLENEICVGDILQIGSCKFAVTEPRIPCFKFNIRLNEPQAAKFMVQKLISGFYLKVVEEGKISAGNEITIIEKGFGQIPLLELNKFLLFKNIHAEYLKNILKIEHVSEKIKSKILEDRKSTRLNSSHTDISRMPSSA